jgi:hypothetical protein
VAEGAEDLVVEGARGVHVGDVDAEVIDHGDDPAPKRGPT